jgi:hypothetical protein
MPVSGQTITTCQPLILRLFSSYALIILVSDVHHPRSSENRARRGGVNDEDYNAAEFPVWVSSQQS